MGRVSSADYFRLFLGNDKTSIYGFWVDVTKAKSRVNKDHVSFPHDSISRSNLEKTGIVVSLQKKQKNPNNGLYR